MQKFAVIIATGFIVLVTGYAALGLGRTVDPNGLQANVEAKAMMPSFAELHASAHLENLPIQEVKEPF